MSQPVFPWERTKDETKRAVNAWAEVDAWARTEGARQNTAFVAWRCFAELRAKPLTDKSPDPLRDRRFLVRGGELMAVRRGHLDGRRRRRWQLKGERAKLSYLDAHPDDTWEGVHIGRLLVALDQWQQQGCPRRPLRLEAR